MELVMHLWKYVYIDFLNEESVPRDYKSVFETPFTLVVLEDTP